jgi:AcrR family transcriptional regulator
MGLMFTLSTLIRFKEKFLKKKYHHGDVKNALIEAGIDIITHEGVESLNMRHVAKKIGVSHTAPYRHFKNKEELMVAIAVHCFTRLGEEVDGAIMKYPKNHRSQLAAAGKAYIRFVVRNPVYYRIIFGDYIKNKTDHPNFFAEYDRAFKKMLGIVIGASRIRKSGKNKPEITALAVWALLHGYSCLIIDNAKDRAVGSEAQINLLVKKMLLLV